jgi:teichuronic acid biosynthesis glycosyltransferase TuaG
MFNTPLVSVILTTYNRVNYLKCTLESILNQTYNNIEVIIISDASNDGTDSYVQSLSDSRIKFFELNINSGLPAVTRNFGIKKAIGEYIAFCDDDDIWIDTKIEKQLLEIENFGICFTKRSFINQDGFQINHRPIYIPQKFDLRHILVTNFITLSSVLIRKNLFNTFIGFNESPIIKASEDYDLWIRLLANNIKIKYCDEPLVLYRIHQNNISTNQLAGIKRTLIINKLLFQTYNISISHKIMSYTINYIKYLYYFLINIKK